MIADPPSTPGAVHDNATRESPGVPATAVGAPGVVRGLTVADADVVAAPVPAALVADTLNTYPVPLVNPVTV